MLILGGCSAGDGANHVDADVLHDLRPAIDLSIPYPAPFPAAPQVENAGGYVMANPIFVPVFFSNFDSAKVAPAIDFLSKVGATNYWTQATSEYGVGPGQSAKAIMLSESATGTLTASSIETWVIAKLTSNDPAWPTPTRDTVFVLHYPAEVTITQPGGLLGGTAQSCVDFGGYHEDVILPANFGSADVAFAVIPDCGSDGALSALDEITSAESHELIEAATDPHPKNDPAYSGIDPNHIYWEFVLGGGEVADMCAQDQASFTQFPELAYTVQRSWSNVAAAAGHEPCVPALAGEVYFAAVPELPDTVTIGGQISSPGVSVPVGSSKTIPLDLFSDADTGGPFTVRAGDAALLTGGTPTLGITLDKSSGVNGDKLMMTVKSVGQAQYGAAFFYVSASIGTKNHAWFGLVGQ